jgi:hypothetical protein
MEAIFAKNIDFGAKWATTTKNGSRGESGAVVPCG